MPTNPRLIVFALPLTTEIAIESRCGLKIENSIEFSSDPIKRPNVEVVLGSRCDPIEHPTGDDMIRFTFLQGKTSFACQSESKSRGSSRLAFETSCGPFRTELLVPPQIQSVPRRRAMRTNWIQRDDKLRGSIS